MMSIRSEDRIRGRQYVVFGKLNEMRKLDDLHEECSQRRPAILTEAA